MEFDYFIFGGEGYSRVTDTLDRKRLASYIIKSGRANKKANDPDTVLPESIMDVAALVNMSDTV